MSFLQKFLVKVAAVSSSYKMPHTCDSANKTSGSSTTTAGGRRSGKYNSCHHLRARNPEKFNKTAGIVDSKVY